MTPPGPPRVASGDGLTPQDPRAALVLCLLAALCYLPVILWGGFVWDDEIITGAEPVRTMSGLWRIWLSPREIEGEKHYWPLVYTTFWLEHKLWGFNPVGYHVVNVGLHCINSLLVWCLLWRLGVRGAWFIAAIFAVHPVHVESVAWVIERKDLLSALFYLSAVAIWLPFLGQPSAQGHPESVPPVASEPALADASRGRYLLALVLFVAGMLSKSIVITLPAALLILCWWKHGRVTFDDLRRVLPFFAAGFGIAVADWFYYKSIEDIAFDYSPVERALIAARALWFYVGKLLWPAELAVIYPRWEIRATDPAAWAYPIAAAILVALLWLFRQRIGRGPLAGVLFFAVTLSPVLGFVDFGYMQFSFVADRYQYLAGLGVIAVLAGAAAYHAGRLPVARRRTVRAITVVVLAVLAVLSSRQAVLYAGGSLLFSHVIALNSQARGAHHNLGVAYIRQGRYEEARDLLQVAIEIDPDNAKTWSGLGSAWFGMGRIKEARRHFEHALFLDPDLKVARDNLEEVHRTERETAWAGGR